METGNTVAIQSEPKVNKPWQFQPGVSGNPLGKPRGAKHFESLFKEAVKKIAVGEFEAPDIQIVKKVIAKAKEGDLKAAEMVMDRTDGKIDTKDTGGGNITFNVIQFTGDIVNGNSEPEDLS